MFRETLIDEQDRLAKRTQLAYIWARLMGTPLWCLLSMLAFILYKNAHLSSLQVTIIVMLKPASSLFSPYWSQAIYQRPDKIIANLRGANFLRHLPFLFIPWLHSSWFIIFAFGFYMMLSRAAIPAWMEIFKYNLPKAKREQLVSYGTAIDYLGTALLAVGMGILLDRYLEIWKWLFFITGGLGILSTFFFHSISPAHTSISGDRAVPPSFEIKEKILKPWKQVWTLIREHKNFTIFQIGFMLGGAGLMIMQPALPRFFIDTLHLSFVEMGLALSVCKGIGVAISSPFWTKLFRKLDIFQLSALVTFFATLFPFLLLSTSFHVFLLYLAYAFYGIMQGGSELSWHMSGLVFAEEKDSSTFSITNVLTVGIRGCIIPIIGGFLVPFIQPLGVILLGAFLCLLASWYFLFNSKKSAIKEILRQPPIG